MGALPQLLSVGHREGDGRVELTLESFLTWVFAGGGASILMRWIVAQIPDFMENLSEQERAILSGTTIAILVAGFFSLSVVLGLTPDPATTLQWFEVIFSYVASAVGLPAFMSVYMSARYSRRVRLGVAAVQNIEPNKLFGIRW